MEKTDENSDWVPDFLPLGLPLYSPWQQNFNVSKEGSLSETLNVCKTLGDPVKANLVTHFPLPFPQESAEPSILTANLTEPATRCLVRMSTVTRLLLTKGMLHNMK